ncbi:MAG: SsrA-binding protein SmpB [Roseiflexaceae bacterium]
MGAQQKAQSGKTIADNRNAYHEYFVEQRYVAGIALSGSEVKSIRAGKVQLRGSYARIEGNEAWLYGANISPYAQASTHVRHEPERKRKLLLRRKEINDIVGKITRQGYTFVPLRMFFDNQFVEVELGIAKGKKQHDKRHAIAERDVKRDLDRRIKASNR